MDYSTPGLPVHHQLLELAQTHVHGVSDAIQLSHPLSSPSPPGFNLSQRQKDRTLKDKLPRSVGTQYVTDEQYASGEIAPEAMKRLSQSGNNTQWWM